MEVLILPTPSAAAQTAAEIFGSLVGVHPTAVLGLATGGTPLPLYAELAQSGVDFSQVTCFLLDEYVGLPPTDPRSYRWYAQEHIATPLGIDSARIHSLDGTAGDLAAEAVDYEARISAAGGIDLQLVGIGSDGHLAFNEPGSSLRSRTRVKTLAEHTRRDNARYFDAPEDVPSLVLTQGLETICEARRVLLLATGQHKAAILAEALEGPLTALVPASILQQHPHCTVILDEVAASQLRLGSYHRQLMGSLKESTI